MNKQIVQTDLPSGLIDLGSGNPSLELLPMEMLARAAESYFSAGDRRTLQYGAEQGNGFFLGALANFLSPNYGFTVNPDALFATTGASTALSLICTMFTQPGDAIVVEEPTYFLALSIFADHRLEIHRIPMDRDGLDVDALEDIIATVQPKFVYTIPSFHNPASITMSQERREKLVSLAQEHDFLVIADEVYQFLAFTREPPQPFGGYTGQIEQVVSINSFSKILAPGLRLGWIQAHHRIIKRLVKCGLMDSGGGLNPFTSAVVYYLIESGDLTDNIRQLRDVYQLRLEAMAESLERYLPEANYWLPQGGYFFWVRLPGRDTGKIREQAWKRKVDFRPGRLFSSEEGLKDYLRLSFSYYNPDQIEHGISLLAESVQST